MPQLLLSANPSIPIGIDPFWEDPLTIWPADRKALLDLAQAFPTGVDAPVELQVLGEDEVRSWRDRFAESLRASRDPAPTAAAPLAARPGVP